jgi:phosphatidylserine/phosphatidylglycerophosphate/cardiolipin synthase-like enzyme
MKSSVGAHGVIFDVDGVLRWASLRRMVGRLRALRTTSIQDRRSALALPRLLRAVSAELGGAPVFYLTSFPIVMARPIARLLARDGYPSGTLVTTGRNFRPRWFLGGSRKRKLAGLELIADRMPALRWVLLGDDGADDPRLFLDFAHRRRGQVAVIGLRQVFDVDEPRLAPASRSRGTAGAALVGAPNGEELLPEIRAAMGIGQPRQGSVADWFLSAFERGNPATDLSAWTEGNAVRPLVHGRVYFEALARALETTGDGDLVHFVGWRADADELLADGGPTVGEALSGAASRGARVCGLLWHAHADRLVSQVGPNRAVARAVGRAGGEVLLDQRVRPFGSHHQKMVLIRHRHRPQDDVAFIGGIDLDHGSRDDADHRGDPQSTGGDPAVYGPNPPYHDIQLELHGPVVREAEETFRERWHNPAALSRLPWQVIPDRIHGLPRRATPLPPARPASPVAGTCAVQLLRTYPRRRPRYPYAPRGERSIALAYTKALGRAGSLIYLEDQYLWSFDIARIFAAALHRSPRLHLIAVVPRRPDNENFYYNDAALLGHAEALAMVRDAGGDRVQVLDVENDRGLPVYVHSKLCIVDDVWAAIGSDNFNMRSWTHDSELTAAVLDADRDPRAPADPGGLGDGARGFARGLRLAMMREHLDLDEDEDLLDPVRAAETVRKSAAELDAWHASGRRGPRPAGRLRSHPVVKGGELPARHRWFTAPIYRSFLDPDGRPLDMRMRRTY